MPAFLLITPLTTHNNPAFSNIVINALRPDIDATRSTAACALGSMEPGADDYKLSIEQNKRSPIAHFTHPLHSTCSPSVVRITAPHSAVSQIRVPRSRSRLSTSAEGWP